MFKRCKRLEDNNVRSICSNRDDDETRTFTRVFCLVSREHDCCIIYIHGVSLQQCVIRLPRYY